MVQAFTFDFVTQEIITDICKSNSFQGLSIISYSLYRADGFQVHYQHHFALLRKLYSSGLQQQCPVTQVCLRQKNTIVPWDFCASANLEGRDILEEKQKYGHYNGLAVATLLAEGAIEIVEWASYYPEFNSVEKFVNSQDYYTSMAHTVRVIVASLNIGNIMCIDRDNAAMPNNRRKALQGITPELVQGGNILQGTYKKLLSAA